MRGERCGSEWSGGDVNATPVAFLRTKLTSVESNPSTWRRCRASRMRYFGEFIPVIARNYVEELRRDGSIGNVITLDNPRGSVGSRMQVPVCTRLSGAWKVREGLAGRK